MAQELVYTSAEHGLQPRAHGFCTVAMTAGLGAATVERLENISGYRAHFPAHHPDAARNPVAYAHYRFTVAGQVRSVLSRVGFAGFDYTGRSNKLAHHLVLADAELQPAGPAAVGLSPGLFLTAWAGPSRLINAPRAVPAVRRAAGPAAQWAAVAGDAGWAGALAEHAMAPGAGPAVILYQPGFDTGRLLSMLDEAMALVPPDRRWDVTYNTYLTDLPMGTTCLWRCMLPDSPELEKVRRNRGVLTIDLTGKGPGRAPDGRLAEAARSGVDPYASLAAAAVDGGPATKAGPATRAGPASVGPGKPAADVGRAGAVGRGTMVAYSNPAAAGADADVLVAAAAEARHPPAAGPTSPTSPPRKVLKPGYLIAGGLAFVGLLCGAVVLVIVQSKPGDVPAPPTAGPAGRPAVPAASLPAVGPPAPATSPDGTVPATAATTADARSVARTLIDGAAKVPCRMNSPYTVGRDDPALEGFGVRWEMRDGAEVIGSHDGARWEWGLVTNRKLAGQTLKLSVTVSPAGAAGDPALAAVERVDVEVKHSAPVVKPDAIIGRPKGGKMRKGDKLVLDALPAVDEASDDGPNPKGQLTFEWLVNGNHWPVGGKPATGPTIEIDTSKVPAVQLTVSLSVDDGKRSTKVEVLSRVELIDPATTRESPTTTSRPAAAPSVAPPPDTAPSTAPAPEAKAWAIAVPERELRKPTSKLTAVWQYEQRAGEVSLTPEFKRGVPFTLAAEKPGSVPVGVVLEPRTSGTGWEAYQPNGPARGPLVVNLSFDFDAGRATIERVVELPAEVPQVVDDQAKRTARAIVFLCDARVRLVQGGKAVGHCRFTSFRDVRRTAKDLKKSHDDANDRLAKANARRAELRQDKDRQTKLADDAKKRIRELEDLVAKNAKDEKTVKDLRQAMAVEQKKIDELERITSELTSIGPEIGKIADEVNRLAAQADRAATVAADAEAVYNWAVGVLK